MRGVRLLPDPTSYLRMVFVLIGAGLALSFGLLDSTVIAALVVSDAVPLGVVVALGSVLVTGPIVGFGLMPAARSLEAAAAESLLGVKFAGGLPGPARDWPQRRRSLAWFLLHLLSGTVPAGLIILAFQLRHPLWVLVALVVALLATAALGSGLAVLAPSLLGPSHAERIATLEGDLNRAAERNRIAREIHDSVGHALSLITVQAAGAKRVIARDREFATAALDAIEDASRSAVAELDHMLGLLREEDDRSRRPPPDLADLDSLVAASKAAGLALEASIPRDLRAVRPAAVSREAYRIVQEGLTNAMRHASPRRATLRIRTADKLLHLSLTNPTSGNRVARQGRGLRGISERVKALGGTMTAGARHHEWRLVVQIPMAVGSPQ